MTAQTIDLPMGHDMPFDGGPEELVRRQRQASLSSSSSRRSTRREAVRPPPRQRRRARRGSKSRSVIILLARRRASPPAPRRRRPRRRRRRHRRSNTSTRPGRHGRGGDEDDTITAVYEPDFAALQEAVEAVEAGETWGAPGGFAEALPGWRAPREGGLRGPRGLRKTSKKSRPIGCRPTRLLGCIYLASQA